MESAMFKKGDEVFLQVPDGSAHLHRGRIVQERGDRCLVELDPTCPAPEAGQEIMLFTEPGGEFMRHVARVQQATRAGTAPVLDLRVTGEPVSAERRRHRRVSYMSAYDAMVRTMVKT